jgi:lactoylglutathione lyase
MKKLFSVFALLCLLTLTNSGLVAQGGTVGGPHFNHTTIYVVDLKKSADFYEQVMELDKIPEPFHDNKHVWFKMGEHNQLHVVQGATAVMAHDINIHLAFSVPSLDDFMGHLDKMKVKYGNWKGDSKTPQMRPDQIRQIYFQDPEGYWIEVNEDKF